MTELRGQRPDEIEASFAYLQTIRMQAEVGNALAVRVDLVDRERLREAADRLNAGTCDIRAEDRKLADIVNPLIIEPDGAVVPLQYGFSRRCQVGNLHRTSFSAMAAEWKRHVFPEFRELCARVFASEMSKDTLPIFNWYGGDLECQPRVWWRDRDLRVNIRAVAAISMVPMRSTTGSGRPSSTAGQPREGSRKGRPRPSA